MVFVTESGKEIQVPSDYTYMSLEKFANEIYRQGRVDERAKVIERMYVIYNSKNSRGKHYIEEFVKQIEREFAIK